MVGINPNELREHIVRPTLLHLGLWSDAAENLLLGTAAHESLMGHHLKQVGGPALGIYQMEPNTHNDIWDNFLIYKSNLATKVTVLTVDQKPRLEQLVWNLAYATAMCRVHYYRVSEALPAEGDEEALARYWKKYYNTPQGKGTEEDFIKHYQKLVIQQQ